MIRVSAGVIRDRSGKILICRRGEGRKNAHLWEFPGGKREAGEDAAACLRRELLEELSLPVSGLSLLCEREEGDILFSFLTGTTDALPRLTEHEDARFVAPRQMLDYGFCPADTPVARALAFREPPIRAVFWDFDGPLFDTYPMMTRALTGACARLGAAVPPEEALRLMKDSLSHALSVLSERHHLPLPLLSGTYQQEAAKTPPVKYPLMPGMREALTCLQEAGCRHFLVTHRDRSALRALAAAGLSSCFSGWVTEEDGFPRKPDPASVLHLLRTYALDPDTVCMVGDRPLDVQAAQAAGIVGCLFDPDRHFPGEGPLRIETAAALPPLLLGQL